MEVKDTAELKISLDGDNWCALLGDNLQEGVAGFSVLSPLDAVKELCNELETYPFNMDLGIITLG